MVLYINCANHAPGVKFGDAPGVDSLNRPTIGKKTKKIFFSEIRGDNRGRIPILKSRGSGDRRSPAGSWGSAPSRGSRGANSPPRPKTILSISRPLRSHLNDPKLYHKYAAKSGKSVFILELILHTSLHVDLGILFHNPEHTWSFIVSVFSLFTAAVVFTLKLIIFHTNRRKYKLFSSRSIITYSIMISCLLCKTAFLYISLNLLGTYI